MSDPVWVQEDDPEPGWWAALCCDGRCSYQMHAVLETRSQTAAKAAATRHRKYLATLLPAEDAPPRTDECEACGQSSTVVRQLQELVEELEARLARTEKESDRVDT